MNNILSEVLAKIGKKYEELSPQARSTYDEWEKTLTVKPVTPALMADFLRSEIERNTAMLTSQDVKLDDRKDMWLKMAIQRDKLFLGFIETPDQSAKKLESYLKQFYQIK